MTKSVKENPVMKWARTSASNERIKAMIEQAKPLLAIKADQLDQNPWLFNCRNGTIDLRTGELKPHNREDYLTKLVNINFNHDAEAPDWIKFLNEIFDGKSALIKFVQRFVGYSLTGNISEQSLVFLHGDGANGKTTFINAIRAAMGEGEYAQEAAPDLLLEKRFSNIPNDIARLRGARLVTVTETSDGRKYDEGLIKRLTGGDRITARFLNAEFFEFNPTHKLWLISNHKPVIKGIDHAIWRRINLIPFERTFSKDEQDKELPAKLLMELPGILAWAVRGCLEWQRIGLSPPSEVRFATAGYKTEMDVLQNFIDEHCETTNKEACITARELYDRYKYWAKENGEQQMTNQLFGRQLTTKGFLKEHKSSGDVRKGLSFKTNESKPDNSKEFDDDV